MPVHIILTRFNVKPVDREMSFDKNKKSVLTKEWLEKRFILFEKYYLPSLAIQTNKNFVSFVYFDTDTPQEFIERIKRLAGQYPFFIPKYVADYEVLRKQVIADVVEYCKGKDNYVITTRIDNDDSYHRLAVEKIQKNFVPQDKYGINFYKGYRLLIGSNGMIFKNMFLNGPFISMVEEIKPNKEITTVLNITHQDFFAKYETKQIKDDYLWLQVIHDSNLVNDISGLPSLNTGVLKNFGLNPQEYIFNWRQYLKYWLKFILNIKNFVPLTWRIYLNNLKNKLKGNNG